MFSRRTKTPCLPRSRVRIAEGIRRCGHGFVEYLALELLDQREWATKADI
jgi:hypothetical protein